VLLCSLEIAWVTRVGRRMLRVRHVASPNTFGNMRGLPNPIDNNFVYTCPKTFIVDYYVWNLRTPLGIY
jgi:hypothetical protein